MSRVRIFIDFWNFSLGMRRFNPGYRLSWEKLPGILVTTATLPSGNGTYEGACVYASVNSTSIADRKLKAFLVNMVNRLQGYEVKIFERKPAKPPRCSTCGTVINTCPSEHCASPLKRTVEKGVDTAIVTDMLQHAWDDTYDIGVLLSADADFIPAVRFLNRRGKKIVHAGFTNLGHNLAKECWHQIDLTKVANQMHR